MLIDKKNRDGDHIHEQEIKEIVIFLGFCLGVDCLF